MLAEVCLCNTASFSLTSNCPQTFLCILCCRSNVSFDIFTQFTARLSWPKQSHLFQTFLLLSPWGESIVCIAPRFDPKKSLSMMKLTWFVCNSVFAIFWGCDDWKWLKRRKLLNVKFAWWIFKYRRFYIFTEFLKLRNNGSNVEFLIEFSTTIFKGLVMQENYIWFWKLFACFFWNPNV